MTFVILTGGIDLSVGSVLALTTMSSARAARIRTLSPWLVMPLLLVGGAAFGALQGFLIHRYRLQPFIVTLAGMFVARGLCYLIDTESIPVRSAFSCRLAEMRIPLGGSVAVEWRRHRARRGGGAVARALDAIRPHGVRHRRQRALGAAHGSARGSDASASTRLSGFCAALAGLTMTVYMLSGYSLHAVGLELDAIAAVVIGGTLLTGGVGYVAGTVVGVLILGIIQTLVIFNGTLSSWWTSIVVGTLLFLFCVAQRLIEGRTPRSAWSPARFATLGGCPTARKSMLTRSAAKMACRRRS